MTYSTIPEAASITLPAGWNSTESLAVTISVNGQTLSQGNVPLNITGYEMPFSLGGLQPRMEAYNVSCLASYSQSTAAMSPPSSSAAMPAFKVPSLPAWVDLFSAFEPRDLPERRSTNAQNFTTSTTLSYLPNPTNSTVTKMDMKTGALLAKPANGSEGDYAPVFPIGFYTAYDGYLASNLSNINNLATQGFTVVSSQLY